MASELGGTHLQLPFIDRFGSSCTSIKRSWYRPGLLIEQVARYLASVHSRGKGATHHAIDCGYQASFLHLHLDVARTTTSFVIDGKFLKFLR